MGSLVEWPEKPHFSTISFRPGEQIKINALIPPEAARANILFKCGEDLDGDIALFISLDVQYRAVTITSKDSNGWGEIFKYYGVPLKINDLFQIFIHCSCTHYNIYICLKHICDYKQLISSKRITHLAICGDFHIESIKYISRPAPHLFPSQDELPPKYRKSEKTHYGTMVIPMTAEEPEKLLMYPTMTPYVPVIPLSKVKSTEIKVKPYSTVTRRCITGSFLLGSLLIFALYIWIGSHDSLGDYEK